VFDWAVPGEVTVPVDPAAVLVLLLELEDPHAASASAATTAAARTAAGLSKPRGRRRCSEQLRRRVVGRTRPEYPAESSGRRPHGGSAIATQDWCASRATS